MKNKITYICSAIIFSIVSFVALNAASADTPLYQIQGEKIIYTNNNSVVIADGNANAKNKFGSEIFAEKIIYNKIESTIKTEGKSIYIDGRGNKLLADSFYYDLNLKIIDAKKNVRYIDNEGNILSFASLKYYEESEKGSGQDLRALLTDKSTMEGAEAEFDNKLGTLTLLKKNSYTPCKNIEESSKTIEQRCPDWSISTTKTTHDKIDKMVYHKNAVIKIRNVPVFYTPYFSHPDPSVKRKSGFLPPSVKNFNNLGQTIKTPYFWAISEDKDLTFSPIYYFDENSIFLSEYRQKNKNSTFFIDSSYTEGYKNLNKKDDNGKIIERTAGSRNHLFFNFLGSYKNLLFSQNDLEINIQTISDKNYLKVNEINTENIRQDVVSLNNNVVLNSYEGNQRIKIESNIYENLNIEDKNTKYQYTFPSIEYGNYINKFNQFININNSLLAKNLGGDSNQAYFINEISSESSMKIFDFLPNVANIFKTSTKNVNAQNSNMPGLKEDFNSDTYLTLGLENTFPMIRSNERTDESLTPKILTKFTTGSMANSSKEKKILSYQDIYSMNRMNNVANPETGGSIGYGADYNIRKKNTFNQVYFDGNFSVGQVIKNQELKEMPSSSSLGRSSSDFVGNISFFYDAVTKANAVESEYSRAGLSVDYNYIVSDNLNKILQNDIEISYQNTKDNLTANYYETHDISNEHYVDLKYGRKIADDFNITVGGRKNLETNFTESNFFGINYETDCIKIGLNLSKTFYQDNEVRPANNLTLSLVLKPFGSPVSPDLSNFLK